MEPLTVRFKNEVFKPYLELLKSNYRFHRKFEHARRSWEDKLTEKELVRGPFLEKSQSYKRGEPMEDLELHHQTVETIRSRLGKEGSLYQHQTEALDLVLAGQNALISTGTSSGKTLCYQIPILDDLVRDPSPGLRAVIIYPLNALVNDQLTEWEQILRKHPNITFARFTGQTPASQEKYETRLREQIEQEWREREPNLSSSDLQRKTENELADRLEKDPKNRLNHRDAIRQKPPHILVTNFSMLEYFLERPVDAPIFENAQLRFLVLDEIHAYRGIQSTEIAFLIRRLKERLRPKQLACIGTSATIGDKTKESGDKARQFAADIFGEPFVEPNPIRGETDNPQLRLPSHCPSSAQYLEAANALRDGKSSQEVLKFLGVCGETVSLAEALARDENLRRLRTEILTKPTLLADAAEKLFPQLDKDEASKTLQFMLELVAASGEENQNFLPTRLHYFVRAQGGLHVCLRSDCPGRSANGPAFFVSRQNGQTSRRKETSNCPEGQCPDCHESGEESLLVETVSCRKCGYLYGALQDLGPRRAQNPGNLSDKIEPSFDSFSTELGWAADSFWSYFSVENDLPFPKTNSIDDEDVGSAKLLESPKEIEWCACCGKKKASSGDCCRCETPHFRQIQVFHRQCDEKETVNLYMQTKKPLLYCPNCGARNASGIEPVQRFQESEDETGLAMAIPLAHFQVSPKGNEDKKPPRKLLCFTDHRQRAAAFPSLLEEETFTHDLGRKIVHIIRQSGSEGLKVVDLGCRLFDTTHDDPDFFLPVSRFPDGYDANARDSLQKQENLWISEALSYFGIPDSARESAEDLGLVAVEYRIEEKELAAFHDLFKGLGLDRNAAAAALQILLGYLRQNKSFTLPPGVQPDDAAFGRVFATIAYDLATDKPVQGWLLNKKRKPRNNFITSFLRRLTKLKEDKDLRECGEKVWQFLTSEELLHNIRNPRAWQLYHERIIVKPATDRYECPRCGIVTAYSARGVCPRKECDGMLEAVSFEKSRMANNLIAQWVAGQSNPRFTTLKSEEHTAQINKDLAKRIEDQFREDGVNLLSSTTTFELGVNIGDLQKALLRNAPPASANYVQRVGRTGRGKDKNSVCVTICRRTKYDADMWKDPERLMSGSIRTPTVFLENRQIAQRHFNAVAFARFLRDEYESTLGKSPAQKIPLEPFLPSESRKKIREGYRRHKPEQFLGFSDWARKQTEDDLFVTENCVDLLKAVKGFSAGVNQCRENYDEACKEITDELNALAKERERLSDKGYDDSAKLLGDSIKKLLATDVIAELAKRGFLPRYAFPLDVATLETGFTRWSWGSDVELSRDRGIAISEFAPGAQVVARKQVFTSEGLYVVGHDDKPERRWYARCRQCDQIETAVTQKKLGSQCPVCKSAGRTTTGFVEPSAFSIRVDKGKRPHFRRATLLRQRQPLTHFTDRMEEEKFEDYELFHLAWKPDGKLFRYNLGPENKGFVLCRACGYSASRRNFKKSKHKKLRWLKGQDKNCENKNLWGIGMNGLAYGHEFQSHCLVVRPQRECDSASLMFALQKGLCRVLELEASDVGVTQRWLSHKNVDGAKVEFILYDQTPGGAGFVKDGKDRWPEVVEQAKEVCRETKNHCCDKACYDCLKDFGNQSYHEDLNRSLVLKFFGIAE